MLYGLNKDGLMIYANLCGIMLILMINFAFPIWLVRNRNRRHRGKVYATNLSSPQTVKSGRLLAIIKDEEFGKKLEDFCRENYCLDSLYFIYFVLEFLKDVETKETDDISQSFQRGLNQFILPFSRLEVNISSKCRQRIVASQSSQQGSQEVPSDIFNEAFEEVAGMLYENLYTSFMRRLKPLEKAMISG